MSQSANNSKLRSNLRLLNELVEYHWGKLIVGLGLVFVVLSLAIGLNQDVWFDEAYSIQLSQQPIEELIRLTAVDVHPPVYYLFLKFWGGLFGYSQLSLRLSSVILMALALIVVAVLVKQIFSKRISILTMGVMIISPMLIRYGFELRMYALATLICCVATYLLWKIQHKAQTKIWRWGLVYAALLVAGMMTLYYTVVIWLAHFSYCVFLAWRRQQPLLKQSIWVFYGLAALGFLPWLPTMLGQFTNGALANISEPLTASNLLGIISFNFLYQPFWQLTQLSGLLALVIISILIGLFIKNRHDDRQQFLWFMVAAPIVIIFVICLIKPMYVERYLVYFSPFLMALIGVWMSDLLRTRTPKAKFTVAVLLVGLGLGVAQLAQVGNFNFQRMQKPDVASAASLIDSNLPVIANSPYEATELRSYSSDEIYFYAPYDELGGGYAIHNHSQYQVKDLSDLAKFGCFNFVYYDDQAKDDVIMAGFAEMTSDLNANRAMKVTRFCR